MESSDAAHLSSVDSPASFVSPAHRALMMRRELAQELGVFSIDSKLLECPTCGADVPDHAYDHHVSLHPVCFRCRTSFISDFVLEIHRVSY